VIRADATAAGFRRQGRRAAKWDAVAAGDDLHFNFRVNPKASAIRGWPGEFWPVIVIGEWLRRFGAGPETLALGLEGARIDKSRTA
jgi:hypothetical protein